MIPHTPLREGETNPLPKIPDSVDAEALLSERPFRIDMNIFTIILYI